MMLPGVHVSGFIFRIYPLKPDFVDVEWFLQHKCLLLTWSRYYTCTLLWSFRTGFTYTEQSSHSKSAANSTSVQIMAVCNNIFQAIYSSLSVIARKPGT